MDVKLRQVTPAIGFLGKYLLATGRVSWTVELGFCSTHVLCNRQARLILEADGHVSAAGVLEAFSRELDLGVCWADSGWGCLHHFYHAKTGNGVLGRAPADIFCERYFMRALNLWKRRRYAKAMFFLGVATHLLQDVCEPHHTACYLKMGHSNYERWVQKHKEDYLVYNGGIYKKYRRPEKWLKACAHKSYELFDLVSEKLNIKYYQQATECLLPLTQRVTAGFWLSFLNQVEIELKPVSWMANLNTGMA